MTTFTILLIAVLLSLVIFEMIHSYKEQKHRYERKDTMGSVLIGVIHFTSTMATKGIAFCLYELVYKFHLFSIDTTWHVWLIAVVLADLSFYWYHRVSHHVNWFWAAHSVHHSSDKFNFAVAFRLPICPFLFGTSIFWLWMPFLGFNPIMTIVCQQICLFYQTWIHTEGIKKLPAPIEFIFNTPSHHRVHHASNLNYLDKNHAGMLIVWDRIFGTFQEEDEKPVYGFTKKNLSGSSLETAFSELRNVFSKAFRRHSMQTMINYLIKSPGWSHDGSTKTVKQIRQELKTSKHANCKGDCKNCPLRGI
jgi:sterol desaturase/sphingolipid hydroxylase (fatty acid hydroxylase superfamily)